MSEVKDKVENLSVEAKPAKKEAKPKQKKESKQVPKKGKLEDAKLVGITVDKAESFSDWFQQILTKGEMLDYYDVSGCYILRPPSYYIWEQIQQYFDGKIKSIGVQNAYFPMFVSSRVLEKEKDHIEGFAPEVAWVTRAGNTELEEPIAIRPTSETVMYPYYAKWIQSYRDLPLRLNQWNSVVRWEFKHPQPFLRTREFLWQEGHTAHLTRAGAEEEVRQILEFYYKVYEELLAVPMIKGQKTSKEKFAGSLFSLSCEGYIPTTGRGIQGATSHCLGQNFSKMFNISVEDPDAPADAKEKPKLYVWQNSWGLSTRTIGVMVMIHGDNKGLVIPPRVAQTQAIVIPVGLSAKTDAAVKDKVVAEAKKIESSLKDAGIRASGDYRLNQTSGWKFADAELKGIPLRIEVGPKDLEKGQCVIVRRDDFSKHVAPLDNVDEAVKKTMDEIHSALYAKAKKEFDDHIKQVKDVSEMASWLNKRYMLLAPFCGEESCEDGIKDTTAKQSAAEQTDDRAPSMGAKSLCTPFDQPELVENTKCCGCDSVAKAWTLFGRSY